MFPLTGEMMQLLLERQTPAFGIIITGLLFSLAFGLHILFASLEWDVLFILVAVDLFVFSQFYGPISVFLSSSKDFKEKKNTLFVGSLIGSPLTIGFWFAVNERTFEPWLIFTGFIPIIIGLIVFQYLNSKGKILDEINTD